MPPYEFLKGLGELFPGMNLFGKHETHDSALSHAESQAHPAQSEGMEGAADRPSARGKEKRRREPSEQRAPSSKKQRMHVQDEGRLLGEYITGVPEDRVEIRPPSRDEVFVQRKQVQSNVTRPKPGASLGHRTQNNIHAPQPGRVIKTTPHFKEPAKVTTGPRTARQMAAQMKALDEDVGDGFINVQSKRRPTNGAPPTAKKQAHVVAISDSDDPDDKNDFGTAEAINGMSVRSDSNSGPIEIYSQSQPASGFFQATEQRNVDQHLRNGQTKRRRRPSSGQNTQSVSSHLPTEPPHPGRPVSSSRDQPTGRGDLAKPSFSSRTNTPTRTGADGMRGKQLLPIDLGKGVDFDVDSMQQRKDDHSVDMMNNGLDHILRRPAKTASSKGERSVDPVAEQSKSRQPGVPPPSDQDLLLRKRFKRDQETIPRQQQEQGHKQQQKQQQRPRCASLVKKMQTTSSKRNVDAIEESPDHLLGGNTPLHRGQSKQRPRQILASSPTRQYSPSDLLPTTFTHSAQKPARMMQPEQTAVRNANPGEEDRLRIPLVQIFSRGCVLDTLAKDGPTDIDLVYQMDRAEFIVEQDGQVYRIPGTDEYMTIGNRESTMWHEGKGSNKVVLKGPAPEGRSNGNILLCFADETGQHECYDWLCVASADTIGMKSEGYQRIERMFQSLAVDVKVDANKQQIKAKSAVDLSQVQQPRSRKTREQQATDDDIVYEKPEEDAKQHISARSRMKGDEKDTSPSGKSPYFITEPDNRTTRKSTRQPKPVKEKSPSPPPAPPRWTETHELEEWHQPVMYPPTGKSRITIDFKDIERLDEGEFLNDNLVGYALRRVEEEMAPEHRDKVHFFNSFFFTAIMQKNGRKGFNYEGVKKWTKNIDLLGKPYVVVPMCENLHWFVAIICNLPSLERKTALLGDDAGDAAETPPTSQKTSVQASPIRDPDEIPDSQEPDKIGKPDEQAMRDLSLDESEGASGPGSGIFQFDENNNLTGTALEAQHEEETAHANGKKSGKKSKKRTAPAPKKYPTDKPTIITLDSFGVGHPGQISTLKKYVEAEAMEKRGMTVAASDIQGMTATGMPMQSNFCDCGLYLVGYVAEFAKDPEGFVTKVLSRQLDQDSDFASFDPSSKRAEIRDDLLKLHDEQDRERLALKKAKKEEKKNKVAVTAVNDAQTSATLTASNGLSRARLPLSPPKQTAETRSPVGAVLPIAHQGIASHGPTDQLSESGPLDPIANDASDDGELLEEEPAKPLVTGGLSRTKITAPDRAKSPAEPSAKDQDEDEEDEMLDGAALSGNEPRTMHKVNSPALDELQQNLFSSVSQGRPTAKNAP